ncbi:TPA: DEAD/DEAH box helicase [Candidatus Gastranaerophilales bacterium HUM_15]|nr:MAG TPA: DEAD/DEAH box helicase [Candidatus Gastranaerophilales bacterium HUM_15]
MYEFPFELDDFQKDACRCITDGKSVVVCAPTGAGKTVIAQHAIHCALEQGKKVFYTTPLKALSNQKYNDFSEKYGIDKVGLLTGDTSINRGAQIVVMTTEVFRNMLYGTNFGSVTDNLKDVKYVILDEVHYMNDEQRGTVWEESIIYCPTNVQIVALSATVANADKLTEWINTVHSRTELINTDFRPVPLRFYYFDSSQPNTLLPLLTPNGTLNKKIKPEKKEFKRGKAVQKRNTVKDVVRNLHEKNMLPAIYFTFSRKKCDEQMEKCASLCLVTPKEQEEIRQIIDNYIAENPYLYKNKHIEYLMLGVASHHAGLLPGWKVLVEKLFQKGLIKVVFATETLAAGINMPARSTVISSISKRTDNGHRTLTPSEFLQMSGRAGRRGMDEIGYVVIVGTPFQTPEEVAELVLSDANPLESKFSPSYSMVLNLLQRFTLEEAKELVLKSFGYFSSNSRIEPLLAVKDEYECKIDECNSFVCYCKKTNDDLLEYNKIREIYVQNRRIFKTIQKQEKKKNRPLNEEAAEFGRQTKAMLQKMHSYECDTCKLFKKHMKILDVLARYSAKEKALEKEIEKQKDIFWNKFLSHRAVLMDYGYIKDDYPTERGITISQIRSENELFLAQVIFSGVLDGLTPAELASVICAITTEDMRADLYSQLPLSPNVRKRLNKIKDIRRDLDKKQKNHDVEDPMYVNGFYSPLIEMWATGSEWDDIIDQVDMGEGDIVRCFKRVIDVLRQFCTISNIPEDLVFTAREAIELIQKSPIDIE